jgi:hypothetical protein
MSSLVIYVRGIKQRNQYIHVEKGDHGLNFLAEPIHYLWCDESSVFSSRHYGDAVAFASCPITRLQRTAGEV